MPYSVPCAVKAWQGFLAIPSHLTRALDSLTGDGLPDGGAWRVPSTALVRPSAVQCPWRRPRLRGALCQKRQQFAIPPLGPPPREKRPTRPEILPPARGEDGPPAVPQRAPTHGCSRPPPSGAKKKQERCRQLPVRVRLPLRGVFVRCSA